MSTKLDARLYEDNAMDKELENDVAELRLLMKDVPEMEEPHPAYWNNFLLRVHERIEVEAAPKRKAWWSPAIIWGSLTGVAALLVVTWSIGIFPFGSRGDNPVIAGNDLPRAQEELVLIPRPLDEDVSSPTMGDEAAAEDAYSIVLTQEDIDMMNAIESDDNDAILREIIDDVDVEI